MILRLSIKIITALLFLICLLDMPYGYYQFVRFWGMAVFIWLFYVDRHKANKTYYYLWMVSAVLINPIVKISLGREIWNTLDVVWAVLLIISIWCDRKK